MWSTAATARDMGSEKSIAATDPSAAQEALDASTSTVSDPSTVQENFPHRRRKRLRDTASQPSADPEPAIPLDASSRLTTLSSTLPTHSWRRWVTTYLALSKPRLTFLIVLTTTTAYSLYPVPAVLSHIAAPTLSTLTLLFLTTGTALCCAAANALNMLMEPAHDAKMSRTRNRPIVRGLIGTRGALLFAALTGAAGVGALYVGVNPTTAFLGALNILLYAGVYTPLKRVSAVNTWAGALVGGIPPLMGWTAAAGQCAAHGGGWRELLLGEASAGGWLLAALLYCWQFPHFNALSWPIRDEYRNAGYRMLVSINPARNARVALRYALLMFPVCWGLAAVGVVHWSFVGTSAVVNSWMAWEAVRFWRFQGAKGSARGLFWASVWHLPIVLVLAMAQKKDLWDRILGGLGWGHEEEWEDEVVDGDVEEGIVEKGKVMMAR